MAEDSSEIVREQSESVAAVNMKIGGDLAGSYLGLQYAQALDAASGWRTINQAIVGKVAESIINISPGEGGSDIAALGQLAKIVQGTPPPTNIPTQGQ